jgi:hypothetical protein
MSEAIELLIRFFVSAIKLLKPGGVKVVMAEESGKKQGQFSLPMHDETDGDEADREGISHTL